MVDTSNLIKGIDVSVIQSVIPWEAVYAEGYQFVICRCFVGNGGKDTMYDKNIVGANAAGLKTAAYHFVYPIPTIPSQPTRDPTVQAKMHATAAGNSVSVVMCDLEWPSVADWPKWNCTAPQIVEWTITYLETYESLTGIRPIVYSYPNFLENIKLPASFADKYKLWIASYTATPVIPAPFTDWVMWQSSGGSQHLPNGVAVDVDYCRDLSLWDVQAVAIPLPAPITIPAPVDSTPAPDPVVASPVPAPAPTPVIISPTSTPSFWQTLITTLSNLFK